MSKIVDIDFKCLKLIEHFECSGNVNNPKWLHAYQDTGKVWTIGIGTTVYFGKDKVKKGDVITPEKAYQLLKFDLRYAMAEVDGWTRDDINQGQFNALVDFAYNCGTVAYRTSQLRQVIEHNPNDFDAIRAQFLRWKYDNGKVEPGLLRRRKAEAWLYQYGELKFFE